MRKALEVFFFFSFEVLFKRLLLRHGQLPIRLSSNKTNKQEEEVTFLEKISMISMSPEPEAGPNLDLMKVVCC